MSNNQNTSSPQAASGCPFHNPSVYGQGDLTYNDYLQVPALLNLQKPQSTPPHHDEMLFIIIHQSYELWFKLILHELETAISHMQNRNVLMAHHFIKRVVDIMNLLVQQIHILETMTPRDFLEFRDRLSPASGFQSIQFRELEFMAGLQDESYFNHFKNRPDLTNQLRKRMEEPNLHDTFLKMLDNLGIKTPDGDILKEIYQNPQQHLPTYLLCEALIAFDEGLFFWRVNHMKVVERIIGFKRGTGGSSGVGYLRSTIDKKCFPELWDVRNRLERGSS